MPVWSPSAALRAIRAVVVVCGLFAFTDQVIGNLQMATFAAFGGFATLVLASFGGTRRDKLLAHLGLAVVGSVLLTIGTMVSSSSVLAALVTVPVSFAVFFAGVAGPNAASGGGAALLAYVLPAASPGTVSMIPDRLAGWWLASVFGTAAVLVLSPRPGDDALRGAASKLAGELAGELEAALEGSATADRLAGVIAAKQELLASFTATPYRPTGLAAADQALANAVELLEWCTALTADAVRERADLRGASPSARRLLAVAGSVLADVSSLLAGADVRPDVERLERCRAESVAGLDHLQPEPNGGFRQAAQASFHAHAIAVAVLAVTAETLVASRLADPEWIEVWRRRWYAGSNAAARTVRRVSSVATAAHVHASVRSVWFVNSLRGAIALGVAVAVADVGSVQHGFWVVLGTLSVLRTNAASTGATALRALAGTAIGFVVGGLLLLVIGGGSAALWAVLPLAVFVAGYAPGTAPFAVGQAAFTVTVAILFNLLAPVGWKVGVVRIEDVALGCAVSVLVGLLFWPRGVAAVVGDDLADAFRSGAAYLRQAVEWAAGVRGAEPDGAIAAAVAGQRLDEALRGFLADQGSKKLAKQDLWRLVGGSLRLRLTAHAVAQLPGDADAVDAARKPLEDRALTLATWYEQLAAQVGRPDHRPVEPLQTLSFDNLHAVRVGSGAYYGIWLCEHLNHLAEHLGDLVVPAARVAELRRQPWWR
ncbi:MAG: FUSC family protein [Solirubrobacterales bacterium]|nr:FUSC family protein [Solirubrobacterales bacterium]